MGDAELYHQRAEILRQGLYELEARRGRDISDIINARGNDAGKWEAYTLEVAREDAAKDGMIDSREAAIIHNKREQYNIAVQTGKNGIHYDTPDREVVATVAMSDVVSDVGSSLYMGAEYNNDDIVTTKLTNTDFLKIIDDSSGVVYYGGDQDWFSRYTQDFGGCGPVAAANILAYMAMTDPELAELYDYDTKNITKADFEKFMEEVYEYVTPLEMPILSNMSDKKGSRVGIPSFGVVSLDDFTKGIEKFSQSKGINLKSNWSDEKVTFDNAVSYIREGLKKNKPVALLNVFNPVDMQWTDPITNKTKTVTYERHWVTITGMNENKKTGDVTLEVSSWGGRASLSFNSLYNNIDWNETFFPAGIMYFEHEK
jgi:hypothetical protein